MRRLLFLVLLLAACGGEDPLTDTGIPPDTGPSPYCSPAGGYTCLSAVTASSGKSWCPAPNTTIITRTVVFLVERCGKDRDLVQPHYYDAVSGCHIDETYSFDYGPEPTIAGETFAVCAGPTDTCSMKWIGTCYRK